MGKLDDLVSKMSPVERTVTFECIKKIYGVLALYDTRISSMAIVSIATAMEEMSSGVLANDGEGEANDRK